MDEQLKVKRKVLFLTEKLDTLRKYNADNYLKAAFAKSVGIHKSKLQAVLRREKKKKKSWKTLHQLEVLKERKLR